MDLELRLFFRFLKLPNGWVDAFHKVNNGEIWMMPYHTRTCVAHHGSDLFPLLLLIAVDRAMRACRFVRSPLTVVNTLKWIIQQRCTWITQPAAMGVVAAAVQVDHWSDRPFFNFNWLIRVKSAHDKKFNSFILGNRDQIQRKAISPSLDYIWAGKIKI